MPRPPSTPRRWLPASDGVVAKRARVLAVAMVLLAGCTAAGQDAAAEATPPEPPTATAEAAVVDAAFLQHQVGKVYFPSEHGAVMIAVIGADGTVTSAARTADPNGEVPSANDVYRIASITKIFTALLTLLLVDEGVVDLDAAASNYVTRVHVPEGVTIRHLLRHTSGIVNDELAVRAMQRRGDPHRKWTPESVIAVVADDELRYKPGEQHAYSNTNYLILGILIEEVTGHPFHQQLRSRILEPLSLEDTYLEGYEDGKAPVPAFTDLRGPMGPIDFDYTYLATAGWAGGAVVSSARDLHALLDAVFSGRLISETSLKEMTAGPGYGLGIFPIGASSDVYGHSGGAPGYQTLAAHDPCTRTTAFWAATNDRVDIWPVVDDVLDRITAESRCR